MKLVRTRGAMVGVALLASTIAVPSTQVAAAGSFLAPVVVGSGVSEPGIVVAPDGTLYVDAPPGLLAHTPTSPSVVFRSVDGGTTWTTTGPGMRADFPGGADSQLAIDPANGTIYMTDLWVLNSTVSRSTDRGATWTANPVQGVPLQDRPWIATAGNGHVYHVTHQIPLGLIASRSLPPLDGLVYPLHSFAATVVDQTECICPSGNLIAEGGAGQVSDKVGVIYATSTGGVKFARSTNSALTFASTLVAQDAGLTNTNFPVVANAGSGRLIAAWLDMTTSTRDQVELSTSADWGATWTAPRPIVTGGTSVYPWVAVNGPHIVVSLYHTTTAGGPGTVPPGTQWFESFVESLDGGATFSPVAVADPTPAKTGPICVASAQCQANHELGDFQTVAIDSHSHALLTYVRVVHPAVVMFAREA